MRVVHSAFSFQEVAIVYQSEEKAAKRRGSLDSCIKIQNGWNRSEEFHLVWIRIPPAVSTEDSVSIPSLDAFSVELNAHHAVIRCTRPLGFAVRVLQRFNIEECVIPQVLQRRTRPQGLPKYAEVGQRVGNCGLGLRVENSADRDLCPCSRLATSVSLRLTTYSCTLNEDGEVVGRGRFRTTPKAIEKWFTDLPPVRVAMEAGTHSIWISEQLQEAPP
jgi:hypothetical protein